MMLRNRTIILVFLLIFLIVAQSCTGAIETDPSESPDKDDVIIQEDNDTSNYGRANEQTENHNNEEYITFIGPLTTDFKDEVNIDRVNFDFRRYYGYTKMESRVFNWVSLSDLFDNIFKATNSDIVESIDKANILLKEVLFNNDFPTDEELSTYNNTLKYIRIKYKDKVEIPLKDQTIVTDDVVVFYNSDLNTIELYVDNGEAYVKYIANGMVEEFVTWYDDFRNRCIDEIKAGL